MTYAAMDSLETITLWLLGVDDDEDELRLIPV